QQQRRRRGRRRRRHPRLRPGERGARVMPNLAIIRGATSRPRALPVATHPTAQLKAGNRVLSLPYAPRGAALGGWAAPWSTLERPGRKPAVVRDGDNLATLNLTVYLAHKD